MKISEKFMQKKLVVFAFAVIACMLWGSAFPSIKVGYKLFGIEASDIATQILFAGCRFVIAGIMVIIIGSVMQGEILIPGKESAVKALKLSFLQTVIQYFFFYVGLAHTTGVKGSIVEASNVFFAIFVSTCLFHMEKISGRKLLGSVLGFAGVVLINISSASDIGFNLMGDGFVMISAFSYALSSVVIKVYSRTENPVLLSGYQFLFGGLIMSIGAFAAGGRLTSVSAPAIMLLLYLAFISAVAYTLWSLLLKYNPVSQVSVYSFTNPIFGAILSAIILKEGSSFGLKGVISLILVSIGVYIVNSKKD